MDFLSTNNDEKAYVSISQLSGTCNEMLIPSQNHSRFGMLKMPQVGSDRNDLEKILDQTYLQKLHEKFKEKETCNKNESPTMKRDEFKSVTLELLRTKLDGKYSLNKNTSNYIDDLFQKIDCGNNESISWEDMCTFIMVRSKDDNQGSRTITLSLNPNLYKFSSFKDIIANVSIKDTSPQRFVAVSKDGCIHVLSGDLTVLRQANIEQPVSVDLLKRRTRIWVTDVICINEINKLAIATASRDIRFYDMATTNFKQIFVLSALPNVALCLCYYFQTAPEKKCQLLFGMDNGDIHMLMFLVPNKSLFEMPFKKTDSSWRVLYSDLPQQASYVVHKCFPQQHSDWVKKIKYYPESKTLLSSSCNAKDSLKLRSIDERNKRSYTYKVTKGIDCFDYDKDLSLIATGGLDHILRLWDPYVTSKPMGILKTHQTAIIDLKIVKTMLQVFSYSKDGVLCIWDIKDQICLQVVHIKYPSNGSELDHGASPMCLSADRLLISAENCIADFQINGENSQHLVVSSTHASSVVAVKYLASKKQIVTISEDGGKIVWDIMSGEEILSLKKYPGEEISAVCIDETGNYLVTGTRNGNGRVWNLLNGCEEKYLEPYDDAEITSIVVLPFLRLIFMFGWARKILSYANQEECSILCPNKKWLQSNAHYDDILCGVYLKPNYLCTCSYDGEVILWNFEKIKMVKKIQTASQGFFQNAVKSLGLLRTYIGSRNSARKRQATKRLMGNTTTTSPVELLLHLNNISHQSNATLISVEGNIIKFWSTIVVTRPIAEFKVFQNSEIIVTALATNLDNKTLCVGSGHGFVLMYNIHEYATVESQGHAFTQAVDLKSHLVNYVAIPNTITTPPPLQKKWLAHDDEMITSISCSQGFKEAFLFTSSTDCSVIMWSFLGEKIGIFGVGKKKNMLNHWLQKLEPKEQSSSVSTVNKLENGDPPYSNNSIPLDVNSSLFPPIVRAPEETCKVSLMKDIEKIKDSKLFHDRSQIVEDARSMKLNSTVLGEVYNTVCDRRMKDRRNRRETYSEVDETSLHSYGGVNNLCSPFKTLTTSNIEDYALPSGMPITPKMRSHKINPYNMSTLENLSTITNWKT